MDLVGLLLEVFILLQDIAVEFLLVSDFQVEGFDLGIQVFKQVLNRV
jgi:hypothetical protein